MKKLNLLVMGLLLPMLAAAQTVKSPNGNVSVTFSLSEKGQPTYEMSYKGKTVCMGRDFYHPQQLQRDGGKPESGIFQA